MREQSNLKSGRAFVIIVHLSGPWSRFFGVDAAADVAKLAKRDAAWACALFATGAGAGPSAAVAACAALIGMRC